MLLTNPWPQSAGQGYPGSTAGAFGGPTQWAFLSPANIKNKGIERIYKEWLNMLFIPISTVTCNSPDQGISHTKTRLYEWLEPDKRSSTGHYRTTCVVSGSLNPEVAAMANDETVFFAWNHPLYDEYLHIYTCTQFMTNMASGFGIKPFLNPTDITPGWNVNDPKGPQQETDWRIIPPAKLTFDYRLFWTKGDILGHPGPGTTYRNLIAQCKTMVLISMYFYRNINGMMAALTQAAKNGAFIAIISDGDSWWGDYATAAGVNLAFNGGDATSVLWRAQIPYNFINAIGLKHGEPTYIPVYPAKQMNGWFNAMHHKNAIIGAGTSHDDPMIIVHRHDELDELGVRRCWLGYPAAMIGDQLQGKCTPVDGKCTNAVFPDIMQGAAIKMVPWTGNSPNGQRLEYYRGMTIGTGRTDGAEEYVWKTARDKYHGNIWCWSSSRKEDGCRVVGGAKINYPDQPGAFQLDGLNNGTTAVGGPGLGGSTRGR